MQSSLGNISAWVFFFNKKETPEQMLSYGIMRTALIEEADIKKRNNNYNCALNQDT